MASYCDNNKFSDISSADEHADKSDNEHAEVLKLFDSEADCDASFSGFEDTDLPAKPKVKSSVKKVRTGPGKGPAKNLKKKAPAKKRKAPVSSSPQKCKKQKNVSENHQSPDTSLAVMMREFFERFQNIPGNSKAAISAAANAPTVPPNIDIDMMSLQDNFDDEQEDFNASDENNVPAMGYSLFNNSNGQDNRVVVSTDSSSLQLPKIFEDQTKFSKAVSENLAEFVNSACTRKADVSAFIEANSVPVNCKSLVPPLINQEIWSYLYPNIQQRDKSMQDVQKILGQAVVPMLKLAQIFESTHIDVTEAKKLLTQAISLACNTFFEMNIKRRYFIRPYVSKKFQQLCSSVCPIEEQLFPKDVAKRMKEISEASQINRQIRPTYTGSKNYRRRPYGRGQSNFQVQNSQYRGRGYQRGPRGSFRGKNRQ